MINIVQGASAMYLLIPKGKGVEETEDNSNFCVLVTVCCTLESAVGVVK